MGDEVGWSDPGAPRLFTHPGGSVVENRDEDVQESRGKLSPANPMVGAHLPGCRCGTTEPWDSRGDTDLWRGRCRLDCTSSTPQTRSGASPHPTSTDNYIQELSDPT